MTVSEPMTFATDLLLGGWTAFWGARLARRAARTRSHAMTIWAAAFAASSLAAVLGGVFHGFGPELPDVAAAALWKVTLLLVAATGFGLVASAAVATLSGVAARVVIALATLELAAFAAWTVDHDAFRYVIYDYGSAMVAVAALHAWRLARGPAPGSRWILAGLAASLAGAGAQAGGLSLHAHFNHNDLYHVLQMGATWLLYRGGREL